MDELASGTSLRAGVLSDVLVEVGPVGAGVALLAVVVAGPIAKHAPVRTGQAGVVAVLSVEPVGADGDAGVVLEEEVDAVDSAAGGTVVALVLAGQTLRIAYSAL